MTTYEGIARSKRRPVWKLPKKRATRKQPERALHAHVGAMLGWLKPRCVYFPVPNGAADLGATLGAMLKAQYKISPGVSDWVFMWGSGCGGIELKASTGSQNDDQKKFQAWCEREGVPYRVARSIDEVVDILELWGRVPAGTGRNFLAGRGT